MSSEFKCQYLMTIFLPIPTFHMHGANHYQKKVMAKFQFYKLWLNNIIRNVSSNTQSLVTQISSSLENT